MFLGWDCDDGTVVVEDDDTPAVVDEDQEVIGDEMKL